MYHDLLRQTHKCRLSENTEISMEESYNYLSSRPTIYPSSRPTIRAWHKKIMETGTELDKKRSGQPRISEKTIEYNHEGKHDRWFFQMFLVAHSSFYPTLSLPSYIFCAMHEL